MAIHVVDADFVDRRRIDSRLDLMTALRDRFYSLAWLLFVVCCCWEIVERGSVGEMREPFIGISMSTELLLPLKVDDN
jgi:hypothetical protein